MDIHVTSDAFGPGEPIPASHSGEGEDISPPLRWDDVPADARQLALIVDDPDAPGAEPWVHWVIYNIAPEVRELPSGVSTSPRPAEPTNTAQGRNSWGASGYGGPMPPPGSGPHRYHFRLYAATTAPTLEPGLTKDQLLEAFADRVLAVGELVGTYERR